MTKGPYSHYITCQGREIHVTQWGVENSNPLIMWHGLARTGRDFDHIAMALSDQYHIIAPDTLGRGLSEWAHDADAEYCLDFYGLLALDLCQHFKIDKMRWLGTSMGAALGIRLAATSLKERISHLVLNDMGPKIAPASIERILTYAGNPPVFKTMRDLENGLRAIYKPYGELTDAQWRLMAETSARRLPEGQLTLHYDPKMVRQFVVHPYDYDQWEYYDAICCPTLLVRGAETDLLLEETRDEMLIRGPKCDLFEVPNVGHAPALNVEEQFERIRSFFDV
jgi:pimeloyl-ACP methyl ester carboxylesterase